MWPLRIQFRLRDLFVMTTLMCVWLGCEFRTTQHRRAIVNAFRDRGVRFNPSGYYVPNLPMPKISRLRYWMGDRPVRLIDVGSDNLSTEELREIEQAFPESELRGPWGCGCEWQ